MSKENDKLANYKKIKELQKKSKDRINKYSQNPLFDYDKLYDYDRLYDYKNLPSLDTLITNPLINIQNTFNNINLHTLNINSMFELTEKFKHNFQSITDLSIKANEIFNNFKAFSAISDETNKLINQVSKSISTAIPSYTLPNFEIHTSLLNQISHSFHSMDMHFVAYESFNNFALSNYNKLNNIITGFNLNFENIFKDIINKPLFNNIDFNSISGFNQTFSNSLMNDFTYIENKTEDIVTNNSNISNIIKDNFDHRDFIDEHIKQIEDSLKKYIDTNNNAKIIVNNLNIHYHQNPKPKLSAKEILLQIFINLLANFIYNIAFFHYTTTFNEKNDAPAISTPAPTSFEGHNTITEIVEQYNKNNTNNSDNASNMGNVRNTKNTK